MITVTQRDRFKGHIKDIGTYTNDEFAAAYCGGLTSFTNNHNEYYKSVVDNWWIGDTKFKYVAYNENGTILPVDHLAGIINAWWKTRRCSWRQAWKNKYDRGARKSAYGSFRHIKTFHERKWAHAWDDEEFAPNNGFSRPARQGHNLPDPWDDYWAHNQKSWKKQSKRKHQWK